MPDFKELVQNLYTSKNRELTSDKLDYIQKTYAGKEQDFVKNFYATIGEDLTEDKFNYINDTYLKKKEPTTSPSLGTQSQSVLQEGNKLISGGFLSNVGDKPQPKQKQQSGFILGEEVGQTQSSRPSAKLFQGVKPIASDKEPDIKEAIDFTVTQRIKKNRGAYDKTLPQPTKEEINKEKEFVTNLYKNGELVPVKENGKSKLVRGTGAIESFLNAVNTKFEHEAVNNFLANANEEEKIKHLNNKLLVTQEQKSAPSGVGGEIGEFVGENIGMLGKGVIASLAATQAALPTGGGSFLQFLSMAEDMGYGGYGSALESNYIRLKQQNPNISDKEAYDKANNAALVGEVTGLATNAALAGPISQNLLGKAPKPNIEVKGVLDGIVNSAKHAVKSYPKVGGVSVAGSLVNDLSSKGIGVDVKDDEILSNMKESAKQMAVMHFGLWGMTEPFRIPSYIRPQIENVVASAPREEVADFYQDGEQKGIFKQGTTQMVLSKLSKFDEQKAVLANMPLSEEQKAAMTGKLLQRQKLVEENSQLKKYGSSFNDKVLENEAKIEQLDKETNGISKTKDIFKFEKDNATGEPAKIKEEVEVQQPPKVEIPTTETVSGVVGETKEREEFKNRVFEKNIQLGEAPKDSHISEEGYNYRTLSNKEIDAIKESGAVLPREGKQKGGNVNTKYWTKGNNTNWYGDKDNQETVRVKQDKFKENEPVKAEDLEVYNKETKKFEPLIKEKQTPTELPSVKEEVTPTEAKIPTEEGSVSVEAKKADIERNVPDRANILNAAYKAQEFFPSETREELEKRLQDEINYINLLVKKLKERKVPDEKIIKQIKDYISNGSRVISRREGLSDFVTYLVENNTRISTDAELAALKTPKEEVKPTEAKEEGSVGVGGDVLPKYKNKSIAERFNKGLDATSVMEGGEIYPNNVTQRAAWRSMGQKEFEGLLGGNEIGGSEAKKGNYFGDNPSIASSQKGEGKYLVEFGGKKVEGETTIDKVSAKDITGIWKYENGKWNKLSKEQAQTLRETLKEEVKVEEVDKAKKEYVSQNGKHKIVYDEKGNYKVINVKTGEEVSKPTAKKIINEAADNYDFSKGKRAEFEEGLQLKDEKEADEYTLENTNNPIEVVEVYARQKPEGQPLSTVEQMIAEMGIGKITPESFKKYGDKNNIDSSIVFAYFKGKRGQKALPIDVVAKEMSDHYGVEIEPQDIVDFMVRFPKGEYSALKESENSVAVSAREKFEKLTGLPLTQEVAIKAIDYEFNKLAKEQQQLAEQQFRDEKELTDAYWNEQKGIVNVGEKGDNIKVEPPVKKRVGEKEAYKDLTRNEKRQIINSKFDELLKELKIEKICPT